MDIKKTAENLNATFAKMTETKDQYKRDINDLLYNFLETNHLCTSVMLNDKKGILKVAENTGVNKDMLPMHIQFHPYKLNGEISNSHKADLLLSVNTISEYLTKVLETYTLDE